MNEIFNSDDITDNQIENVYFYDGVLEYLYSSKWVASNKDKGKIITSGATFVKTFSSLLSLILLHIYIF